MDGKQLPAVSAMIDSLKQSKDKPMTLAVLRNGKQLEFTVQPRLGDDDGTQNSAIASALVAYPSRSED